MKLLTILRPITFIVAVLNLLYANVGFLRIWYNEIPFDYGYIVHAVIGSTLLLTVYFVKPKKEKEK